MSERQPAPQAPDLYKVGKSGETYHRPDGKFLSEHEREMIEANADLIRGSLDELRSPAAVEAGDDIPEEKNLIDLIQSEIEKLSAEQAKLDPVADSEEHTRLNNLINVLISKRSEIEPSLIESDEAAEESPEDSPEEMSLASRIQAAIEQLQKRQSELDPGRDKEEYDELDRQINVLISRRNAIEPELIRNEEATDKSDEKATPELPKELQEKLDQARQEFIDAKIAVESHFAKKWFGGKDRARRLEDAKNSLCKLEIEAANVAMKASIDKLHAESAENGADAEKTTESAEELMAMHVFQKIKAIEQGAGEKYDKMLEERSGFRKLAAKVGRWFTKGSKIAKWAKGAGTGLVAGAATAMVAAWPVTTAVGILTGLGVGSAAREAALEDHAGEKRIVDEDADEWMAILRGVSPRDGKSKLESMFDSALSRSVEDSENRQKEVQKKYRGAMARYALGFAAGSAVVGVSKGVVGALSGSETSPSTTGGGTDANMGEFQEMQRTDSGADIGADGDTGGNDPGGQEGDSGATENSGDNDTSGNEQVAPVETVDFGDYNYPWNWAAEQFGSENAMSKLQELGQMATQDGYSVEWHRLGDGNPLNDWVSINGNSDTQAVLEILSQYAK